jgi:large subunit ribosomal protein L30e
MSTDVMRMEAKEIKAALKERRLIIGTREVITGLKRGLMASVFYTTNCPAPVRHDLQHYATLSGARIEQFDGNSQQLGELCGRPYKTVMVGILK